MLHSLYYPGAVQSPAPVGKMYPEENTVEGVIMHSMQGSWIGAQSVLYDETVDINNRYRAACWHFSILKSGLVLQHYALNMSVFHAGTGKNNRRLIGVEHEGGPPGNLSEPLTEAQILAGIDLLLWIKKAAEWKELSRSSTLWEHNEATSTACPSHRIPWIRYTEAQVTNEVNEEDSNAPKSIEEIAGNIVAKLKYGVNNGTIDYISNGVSPNGIPGWKRLIVDYKE